MEIKSDPTACEQFFFLVVEAHIISLTMQEFGLESVDSAPTNTLFNKEQFLDQTLHKRQELFLNSVSNMINKYLFQCEMKKQDISSLSKESSKKGKRNVGEKTDKETDKILTYAREVLSLGLLYMEYCDAIREGDGLRILRCWRYMLLIFKATDKRKYAIQASTLLFQHHYIFTERMRSQLLWSRTVNVHGKPGRNIPMDLHMEHLNRQLKESMHHLSSNVNEASVIRIGKCLRKLIDFKDRYDEDTEIPSLTGYHTSRSKSKDLKLLVNELNTTQVFMESKGRVHSQFKTFKGNTMSSVNKEHLVSWLQEQLLKLTQ